MKRTLDIVGASLGLVVLSPILLATALVVWIAIGRPVWFRQLRPGRYGHPFELVKFRTMTSARDPDGELLPDAARLTAIGRALRAWSLDELPELWNVVRGEMSLVGPRPLLMEYLPLYSPAQARRHEVRPGITGWAQVNGRNNQTWPDRLAMDVWYVDHHSMLLDVRILAMTMSKVINREGIASPGIATMEKFTGSQS